MFQVQILNKLHFSKLKRLTNLYTIFNRRKTKINLTPNYQRCSPGEQQQYKDQQVQLSVLVPGEAATPQSARRTRRSERHSLRTKYVFRAHDAARPNGVL